MNAKQTLEVESLDVKANFDQIYIRPDPREYFRILHGLDYIIPDLALPIFRQITETLTELRGRPLRILDIGCSYGINAALLRYPMSMERLAQRYADLQAFGLAPEEVVALDRNYYRSWPTVTNARFIGLDSSAPAVNYATQAGILDHGFAEDLEGNDPSPRLADLLSGVDLVISTGCVGYVTAATFKRVLDAMQAPKPWFVSFVLRLYPFDEIAGVLNKRRLVTEKLESVTFVQRRFHSEQEYSHTLRALEQVGIDPQGKEAEGLLHAELFLSRPAEETNALPLDSLVSVTSGGNRPFGRRFQRHADDKVRLVR
ncbi:MAG: class I SAM-dependent methyltransferase [Hyphomicrobiaceae bacterium]